MSPSSETWLTVRGRDGLYLDELSLRATTLALSGEANGNLADHPDWKGSWIRYSLVFKGVLYCESTLIEQRPSAGLYSFRELDDPIWKASVGKAPPSLRFFEIDTYDLLLRIGARTLTVTFADTRAM